MNAREFLDILHVAERLKDTPRHCTTSKGRTESVAEHSWRISLMAFLLRHEFPELDMDKVVNMCLIHDLGECFTGDIPTFLKTDSDRDTEDTLLGQWVQSLPPEVSADLAALYREMDAQETTEAKVYKALDKLEAVIQHNESPLSTWADNEFEMNKTYAFDTVVFSDWLMDLRKEILSDTLKKIGEDSKPVRGKVKTVTPLSPESQERSDPRPEPSRDRIVLRKADRVEWNADGEFEFHVPAPAVPDYVQEAKEIKTGLEYGIPLPVQKAGKTKAASAPAGDEARRNRELVASLERDAIISAMEENMPAIEFPENDDKYNSSRKYDESLPPFSI